MKYGVVGAGTAGAAAALLLGRRGHEVELIERVEQPRPIGAGLLIQPTGQRVLRELGLLQTIQEHGERVARLDGRTVDGRRVIDLAYGELRPGLHGIGLHRGVLFEALNREVARQGIPVRLGVEVDAVDERADGVWVEGTRYDRVVIATGARGGLRPPWADTRPYPWGALWAVFPSDLYPGVLKQVYRDTRQFVGFLPTGRGPGGTRRLVSMFWSVRGDAVEAWRAAGMYAWKEQVRALMPDAPIGDLEAEEVVYAPYFDVRMARWHTERVVWIGDAGHAMSPQLGQGVNLALWDAWVLATCDTLAEYSRLRRGHLRFYATASRALTPFFQSSSPWLAAVRDHVAGPLHRWGWYRRQMLTSLAGVKTGPFSELEGVI